MSAPKKTVLITGCSDGGLGAALAVALHNAGLHVYATARTVSKMAHLESRGIEIMALDVLSPSSIADCVGKIPSLDILINNAGLTYCMPVADVSIAEAKKSFDLNLWAHVAVTQAFLPLIIKSKGTIVNQNSVTSSLAIPFQSVYNAAKAAFASISDAERLELEPFGVTVILLKTGLVNSNLIQNGREVPKTLPANSIYSPAREAVEAVLDQANLEGKGQSPDEWASQVAKDLLGKNPPALIWRGAHALLFRISAILPYGFMDGSLRKMSDLDVIRQKIRQ